MRHLRKTIFEEIKYFGHDEDFEPLHDCLPTGAPCGTIEKLDIFRARLERGESLFHPGDNPMTGTNQECSRCNAYCKEMYSKRKWQNGRMVEASNGNAS